LEPSLRSWIESSLGQLELGLLVQLVLVEPEQLGQLVQELKQRLVEELLGLRLELLDQ